MDWFGWELTELYGFKIENQLISCDPAMTYAVTVSTAIATAIAVVILEHLGKCNLGNADSQNKQPHSNLNRTESVIYNSWAAK